jgi:hypothetical protein
MIAGHKTSNTRAGHWQSTHEEQENEQTPTQKTSFLHRCKAYTVQHPDALVRCADVTRLNGFSFWDRGRRAMHQYAPQPGAAASGHTQSLIGLSKQHPQAAAPAAVLETTTPAPFPSAEIVVHVCDEARKLTRDFRCKFQRTLCCSRGNSSRFVLLCCRLERGVGTGHALLSCIPAPERGRG